MSLAWYDQWRARTPEDDSPDDAPRMETCQRCGAADRQVHSVPRVPGGDPFDSVLSCGPCLLSKAEPKYEECRECGGLGAHTCLECKGSGECQDCPCGGRCVDCLGKTSFMCLECEGQGEVELKEGAE